MDAFSCRGFAMTFALSSGLFRVSDIVPLRVCEKVDNVNYTYTFKNVQINQDFIFTAAGFNSKSYELKVLPKPMLMKFDIQLTYPTYLNKKND
jgi:hypothetical protein